MKITFTKLNRLFEHHPEMDNIIVLRKEPIPAERLKERDCQLGTGCKVGEKIKYSRGQIVTVHRECRKEYRRLKRII